jgi:hypothetical protein
MAQLVEQLTLNQRVPGSSPGAPTNKINDLAAKTERRATRAGSWGNLWGNVSPGRQTAPLGGCVLAAQPP